MDKEEKEFLKKKLEALEKALQHNLENKRTLLANIVELEMLIKFYKEKK